jgi:hypothetical protein
LIDDSGFDSVTDFVVYVLRDIASTPKLLVKDDRIWNKREVELVKDKLRQLGYIG